jgi:hypothetical protein
VEGGELKADRFLNCPSPCKSSETASGNSCPESIDLVIALARVAKALENPCLTEKKHWESG